MRISDWSSDVCSSDLLGLAVGTPALAALGLMVSALTAGLRSSGALAGLLALPLAVPLLIFGAGMLTSESGAPLKFLRAASLLLVAIGPIAACAAVRAGRESFVISDDAGSSLLLPARPDLLWEHTAPRLLSYPPLLRLTLSATPT